MSAWKWNLIIIAVLGLLFGVHQRLVHDVKVAADKAGFDRAVGEDNQALAVERAKHQKELAEARARTQEILHDLQIVSAALRANYDDVRSEFDSLRVCAPAAPRGSQPLPATGSAAGGVDGSVPGGGGGMPSLGVVGAELSSCEIEAARGNALQAWVREHFPPAHQ